MQTFVLLVDVGIVASMWIGNITDLYNGNAVKRDIAERGRELEGILQVIYALRYALFIYFNDDYTYPSSKQYTRFVKPSYDDFVQPTVKNADVVSIEQKRYDSREHGIIIFDLDYTKRIGKCRCNRPYYQACPEAIARPPFEASLVFSQDGLWKCTST